MPEYDLVIRGGTVVTENGRSEADIGIRGGKIVDIRTGLSDGASEVNATGRLVLPGGIDSHCHIDQQTSLGIRTADDFTSGSVSAAFGGTTTIIPFAAQQRGQSLRAAVDDYRRRAEGKAVVDYAFHLIVTDPTEQVLGQELSALVRDGYTSVKVYLTYDALRLSDREALEVLAAARREGAMVMIHAESHDLIAWLTERMLRGGYRGLKYLPRSRPEVAEREATHRAIAMAELVDVPILIVHVSSEQALEQIRWAQARGLRVHAETCPQYLLLTGKDLDRPGFEGAKYCCSPPPRDERSQGALWDGLGDGAVAVFSSDHSAFRFDDPNGKLLAGRNAPFNRVPYGLPGLETRLPLLFSEGVGKGRITLERFVALSATNAARLYGLYPRKGTIAVGGDADVVIWDPACRTTITAAALHDGMDYTPYEGVGVVGWPVVTVVRGAIVTAYGELRASTGHGRLLACDRPGEARPAGRLVSGFDPTLGRMLD